MVKTAALVAVAAGCGSEEPHVVSVQDGTDNRDDVTAIDLAAAARRSPSEKTREDISPT